MKTTVSLLVSIYERYWTSVCNPDDRYIITTLIL